LAATPPAAPATSLAEFVDDPVEQGVLLRQAIAIFSAGHAVASRTDPSLQAAARRFLGSQAGRDAFDRLAAAVESGDGAAVAAAREAVLVGLHGGDDVPRAAAGTDDGAQPQILYIETRAFIGADTPGITQVDTLSGQPRQLVREESDPLRAQVDAVFDVDRQRFDTRAAAALGQMILPHASTDLPPVFGIRGSGLIHAVPFAALPARNGQRVGEVAVPVLLTGPDSRLEAVSRPFACDGRAALVLADPDYAGDGLGETLAADEVVHPRTGQRLTLDQFWQVPPGSGGAARVGSQPLPGTRIEALTLARSLGDRMATTVLSGRQATRAGLLDRLRTAPPALLHLAVHGIGTADDPAMAHLKLSPVGPAGEACLGVVCFDDIALLDLSALELVVLSACSTMRGRIRRGEGVLALAWAFRAAGARAVVSTRWEVNDLGSCLYWRAFYDTLAGGGSVAAAMQAGGDSLRADANFAAPRHWGAYQLIV
jgi:CHAT domain-containing protein